MASESIVKVKEFRDRPEAELRSLLQTKREELYKLAFKKAAGQLTRTHELGVLRKDIARLNTLLRERTPAQARQEG